MAIVANIPNYCEITFQTCIILVLKIMELKAPLKDLNFLAVLRLPLQKGRRSVFVYTRCAERSLPRMKQICGFTEFHFGKRIVLQTNSGISCTAEAKVLFKVCLWVKSLLSIANSTSKCSAQNLGLKVTNRRSGSLPSGYDQRSRCPIFLNMYCLDASTFIGCLLKNFAIFCSQLAS